MIKKNGGKKSLRSGAQERGAGVPGFPAASGWCRAPRPPTPSSLHPGTVLFSVATWALDVAAETLPVRAGWRGAGGGEWWAQPGKGKAAGGPES